MDLIYNKKVASILNLFLEKPSARLTQTQIIKQASISKVTAMKCLTALINQDIFSLEKIGHTNIYTLNNISQLVKQLKILHILSLLNGLKIPAETYLYGSCSRGEYDEISDVDLLIIGDIKREDIINNIENISEKIGKQINFQIFKENEWYQMQQNDKAFFERVEKDKLRII